MGELANDARFLKEALACFALGQFLGEQLDGHQAADHGIVSACHTAMGAGADDFENFVASDLHERSPSDLLIRCREQMMGEWDVLLNEASVLFERVRRY